MWMTTFPKKQDEKMACNFIMFRVIFVLCFMNMYNTEVCRFRIVTNTFECNNRCLYNKLCCIIKTNEHVWILMLLDSIKTKKWNNNEILMQCCYCHLFWVDTAWITSSYNIYRYQLMLSIFVFMNCFFLLLPDLWSHNRLTAYSCYGDDVYLHRFCVYLYHQFDHRFLWQQFDGGQSQYHPIRYELDYQWVFCLQYLDISIMVHY